MAVFPRQRRPGPEDFRWPVAVKNERWKPMVSLPSESLPFISALHHFFTFGPSRAVGARTLGMRNLVGNVTEHTVDGLANCDAQDSGRSGRESAHEPSSIEVQGIFGNNSMIAFVLAY